MNITIRLSLFLSLLLLSSCDRSRLIEVEWIIINGSNGTINITSMLPSETAPEFNSISSGTELLLQLDEWISDPNEILVSAEVPFEELIITNENGLEIQRDVLDVGQWLGFELNENRVRFNIRVRSDDFE